MASPLRHSFFAILIFYCLFSILIVSTLLLFLLFLLFLLLLLLLLLIFPVCFC
ncbi:hypothetical protein GVA99_004476 [Salmonella enterica]|nr:hypothetical protein [Salmonella enterica]